MTNTTKRVAVAYVGYHTRMAGKVQLCGDGLAGLVAGDEVRVRIHGRDAVVRLDGKPSELFRSPHTLEAWGRECT